MRNYGQEGEINPHIRRTYQDSSDNDVEILVSTQGSDSPIIMQSAASSRPAKRAEAASSKYRYDRNAEDDD